MDIWFIIFLILLIIVLAKRILFWTYLWQLKEYHFKRFLDHFRTGQGRQIFLNVFIGIKLLLVVTLLIRPNLFQWAFYLLLFIYLSEILKFGLEIFKKRFLKPSLTAKAILIILLSAGMIVLMIAFTPLKMSLSLALVFILLLDTFSFVIVSVFVVCFWPITNFFQKRLLKKAAKKIQARNNLTVIAITGSYGKTTTKELLYAILSQKFNVLKTRDHVNAEIGIAKTILNELKDQEIFIVETGAYERGKIRQVCKVIRPGIGILTGINQQHLATFGNQDNIVKAKFELIDSLPENGLAFLNIDNEFIQAKSADWKYKVRNKILIGSQAGLANIWAEHITSQKDKFSFVLKTKEGQVVDFQINMPGAHNVTNVLLAIAVSHHLGLSYEQIAQMLLNTQFKQKAIDIKKGKDGLTIIDASYSANPDGVFSALGYLGLWDTKNILVMPSLIELGSASKDVHFKIGQKIAAVCDLAIILKTDHFKSIKDGAVSAGMPAEKVLYIPNIQEVYQKIREYSASGDTIMLEGRVPEKLKQLLIIE